MDASAESQAGHAPAKVNLALHVTGRWPDGYHLLESLAIFTELGDAIAVASADEDRFVVAGHFAALVPIDGGNLVLRARDALRTALPDAETPPVAIRLTKSLPVASGIGGGSSDAAAALRELARHWHLDVNPETLARIGLALGADVPMCLAARPLIARGIGDALEPVDRMPEIPLVLVNPGVAVSTPSVFSALSSRENPPLPALPAKRDFAALVAWLAVTRNDLETPALAIAPTIGDTLAALRANGAALARMSGSGATCFGLFETDAAAARAAAAIGASHPEWFVAATKSMNAPKEI